ncbi:MAG TPA: SGNH/GDSL hydrolase family protein [Thermoanaerobaculia bacterium]|jgi:lysophospholipase L1-like esterase
MATDSTTRKAKKAANTQVDEVLARRGQALRARKRAIAQLTVPEAIEVAALAAAATPTPHMKLAAEARRLTKGWIVAEGDSWFDYPGRDILDWLDQMGYNIESVARATDRVEMMAFGRSQLEKFAAAIEKVITLGQKPQAILLSGGGNDIAGTEFGFLINHAGSPGEGLNASIVTGVVDERLHDAYMHIIRTVTELCRRMLGDPVPIVVHGYGYPIPDGVGVLGGLGPLPGPWLRPGFIEKGFDDLTDNTATMKKLIDRFNDMIKRVAAEFPHVRYVDLRPLLPAEKTLWANEIHPKPPGFRAAAEAIAGVI